jgi:hypothetical protein
VLSSIRRARSGGDRGVETDLERHRRSDSGIRRHPTKHSGAHGRANDQSHACSALSLSCRQRLPSHRRNRTCGDPVRSCSSLPVDISQLRPRVCTPSLTTQTATWHFSDPYFLANRGNWSLFFDGCVYEAVVKECTLKKALLILMATLSFGYDSSSRSSKPKGSWTRGGTSKMRRNLVQRAPMMCSRGTPYGFSIMRMSQPMRRWTLRFCLASLTIGACLYGCGDSSSSDSDGGTDAARGGGGISGGGGVQPLGGAFAQGGATSTGQQSTSRLESRDAGFPDHFPLPDPLPRPDAGLPLGVPACEPLVQAGVPCTAGPTSACVPTSGGDVCLCPAGTWMCF